MGSRLVIGLLLSFAPLSYASVKKAPTFQEIQSLKREVAAKDKELVGLKKTMSSLEQELSKRNQKLVKLFEVKRGLELKINQLSSDLDEQSEAVNAGREQTAKVLRAAILSEMSKSTDPSLLLSQKYLLEGLRQKKSTTRSERQRT